MVYLDFGKVFDTVSYKFLIDKPLMYVSEEQRVGGLKTGLAAGHNGLAQWHKVQLEASHW